MSKRAYAKWLATDMPDRSDGGHHVAVLDRVEPGMDVLRETFAEMPLNVLAGAWVALVVDAAMGEYRIGDLARALNVVAGRLHGVKFPEPVMGKEVRGMSNLIPEAKAAAKHPADALRAELGVGGVVAGSKAAPLGAKGDGWAVETTGELPPRKRKGADPALLDAIAKLGPLPARIRLDGKKFTAVKVSTLMSDAQAMGGSPELASFLAADGYRVIYRKAE